MFKWIIKFINKLKNTYPICTFKVIGIKGSAELKNLKIIYQVSGKSTVAIESPHNIINELLQIKGFSKNDSYLIYNLTLSERLSHSIKISSIHFNGEEIKFELEDLVRQYVFLIS